MKRFFWLLGVGTLTAFCPSHLLSRGRPCLAASSSTGLRADLAVTLTVNCYKASASLLLTSLNRTLGDVEREVGRSSLVELLDSYAFKWDMENDEKCSLFQWCLDQGCDPQPLVHDDRLLIAPQYHNQFCVPELLKLTLQYGANPNVLDVDQRTPLEKLIFSIVGSGNLKKSNDVRIDTARHLLLAGADPNKVAAIFDAGSRLRGVQGDTLLAMAIRAGDVTMAKVLLEYGASPTIINVNTGQSALELLRDQGNVPMIDTLVKILYPLNTTTTESS